MSEPNNADGITNYSRFLPIANIGRIMKKALPENAKIAKDAKEMVQECVSEFISFITSEACEKCKIEKRKTINGEDLLASIDVLGFDEYGHLLKLYLKRYREVAKNEKGDDKGVDDGNDNDDDDDEDQIQKSEEA